MRLANRVACVTGGGSGLGRAMAEVFAAEGASIAVNDLDPTTAKETVEALPGEGHIAVPGDVSDSARVAEIFAEVDERFGRLDVLVNNAGVDRTEGDGFDKLAEADTLLTVMGDRGFSRMLEIHLHGAFFCTREAVKIMLGAKSGSIINVSSIAALSGIGSLHYATAKSGLLGMTRALARELGRHGIRVNAICPGVINTPMTQNIPEAMIEPLIAATPLGRVGEPEDIASAALFLACDESSFLTGQWISPNGGLVIG